VGQPHGEGAGDDGVVQNGLRFLPAVAGDLDAVGLAADRIGEPAQGRPGARSRGRAGAQPAESLGGRAG